MSEAPAEAGDIDEDHGSAIPEPPRRVPFGVAVTTALLGMLALPLILLAMVTLFSGASYGDDVGAATLRGLGAAVVAVCAVLVVAVAWSFVRDGNTIGPMVVGLLVVLTALILLAVGVAGESPDTEGVRVGVLALVLGLGVLLVPLLGHGPAYLAARRVWSRAERDWLQELTTPETPPLAYGQQWQGNHPPQQWGGGPQQQWGGASQAGFPGQPGYPAQQAGYPTQADPAAQPGYRTQAGPAAQPGYPTQAGPTGRPGNLSAQAGHVGQPAAQSGYPAHAGFQSQYQYPPDQSQPWTGLAPPPYQPWPDATVPPWSGEQSPPGSAPATSPEFPATAPNPEPTAAASSQESSVTADSSADNRPAVTENAAPVPLAAAQQAPTEQIRTADQPPAPQETPPH